MTLGGLLVGAAMAFAFINGVNDGGSILAVGLSVRTIRPLLAVALLSMAVLTAPVVIGTGVATTLVGRLVDLDGDVGRVAVLIAVAVAVGVPYGLSRRGLPTSLTLALIGALAGVGAGAGLTVSWVTVGTVLAFAAVAPMVGVLGGWGMSRIVGLARSAAPLPGRVRRWHTVAFTLQCVAYGANDGQKMLAVMAVAVGTLTNEIGTLYMAAIALPFFMGTIVGLPRIASTLGGGIVPVQPPEAVVTELSSATVVLGTAAMGVPVSMTQTISGALIGTGVTRGYGRIRWREAARVAGAWVVTLPASFVLAAALAVVAT